MSELLFSMSLHPQWQTCQMMMMPDLLLPARQLQLAPAFVHGKGPAFSCRAVFAVVLLLLLMLMLFLLVVVVSVVVVAVIIIVGDIRYDTRYTSLGLMVLVAL